MSNRGYQSTTINVHPVGSPTVVLGDDCEWPLGPDGLATVKIQQVNSDGVYEELMRTALMSTISRTVSSSLPASY